ncbi:Histone protein Lsr2 [Pseudonocardia sp. Ae717_Ps2]|uniref:Lsr2 dimerization domain-containing protein n=1 Tax=Pseudonocardia sp. Ae717_Ps2 TaxID=1885573 RepID=UPI00094B3623|nr:histone-like nucleoid-structuring protein Lsr2 [Pseudonocardia sp. Ae717_Ps2]OLM28663.1 Histone protein Lsr2 [Pseudonocardia sp. Ae717_Ps2]
MTRQVTFRRVDDLSGGPATERIRFALDGEEWFVDLNAANAEQLRQGLAPFIAAARDVLGPRRRAEMADTVSGWGAAQQLADSRALAHLDQIVDDLAGSSERLDTDRS